MNADSLDPEDEGWSFVNEVERAKFEDPDFPEVLARKRAMAAGETYKPEKHGPFSVSIVPRMARIAEMQPMIDVEALLARFNAKGNRHLRAEPKSSDYRNKQAGDR